MAAAVVMLLDRGTLVDLTADPDRRLTMTAYWTLHALLIAILTLSWRSLLRTGRSPAAAVLTFVAAAASFAILCGLLVADVVALIQLSFADAAPGVLAIILVALFVRAVWRLFFHPQAELIVPREDGEPTWRDALRMIAMVPLGVLAFVTYLALFGTTWRTASLVLDYALLGHDAATLDWRYPLDRVSWYVANWQVFAIIGAVMVLWIVLEKLFVKPAAPPTDSPQ